MMDILDVQRRFRRRLRWTRIIGLVCVVVGGGIIWFGVVYAVSAIARGDVW